jgi:aryl-alcohol dehydrogenase-like predicted oxidoreductase
MGIRPFDTANVYSSGLSEVTSGKATKRLNLPRDEIVVVTKVYTHAVARGYFERILSPIT